MAASAAKVKMSDAKISVEVAFALPDQQQIIQLSVLPGTTALEAVIQSGIAVQFPIIKPDTAAMGIFSRVLDGRVNPTPAEYVLRAGDRVEVYRPLLLDPKQARLVRAARNRPDRKRTGRTGKPDADKSGSGQ